MAGARQNAAFKCERCCVRLGTIRQRSCCSEISRATVAEPTFWGRGVDAATNHNVDGRESALAGSCLTTLGFSESGIDGRLVDWNLSDEDVPARMKESAATGPERVWSCATRGTFAAGVTGQTPEERASKFFGRFSGHAF